MNVDGLRCILYARIYISYMCTILYYYIQTGRPPVKVKNKLLIGPVFIQPTFRGINRISL